MSLMDFVGQRIKEFRESYPKGRLSQERLAAELNISTNTVSRWETATYKPTVEDLERMARFFSKSILDFFPPDVAPREEGLSLLMRAAKDLDQNDLDELRRFAEFRKAERVMRARRHM